MNKQEHEREKWELYAVEKRKLNELNLPAREYDREMHNLIKRLGL